MRSPLRFVARVFPFPDYAPTSAVPALRSRRDFGQHFREARWEASVGAQMVL